MKNVIFFEDKNRETMKTRKTLIDKIIRLQKDTLNRCFRKYRIAKFKRRMQAIEGDKAEFSVICNNCNAAIVLHEFSLPFNSPFVNLCIPASDYMILLHDFQKTINSEIIDISNEYPEKKYPIGLLAGKIRLFFVHYKSFQEAVDAWRRRSKRINYGNLRIVFVERDGATYEHLKEFDSLSFEHKVALTHKQYPDIKCAFSLKGCTKDDQIDMPYRYSGWFGKKFFDQFDWALFFCGK